MVLLFEATYVAYLSKRKKNFKTTTTIHDDVTLLFFVVFCRHTRLRKEE